MELLKKNVKIGRILSNKKIAVTLDRITANRQKYNLLFDWYVLYLTLIHPFPFPKEEAI